VIEAHYVENVEYLDVLEVIVVWHTKRLIFSRVNFYRLLTSNFQYYYYYYYYFYYYLLLLL